MVAPGCQNVLGNFFPVPLMVAALGALQWKRYQHRCLSGLEAAAVPGGLWKFLAFGSVFCIESVVGCSSKSQSVDSFSRIRIAGTSQETIRLESAETVFLK